LSGNVWALVRHAGHAVDDDGLALGDGEEELVVHPDVRAQHDAVGDLKGFAIAIRLTKQDNYFQVNFDHFKIVQHF